ncbi:uncharacterized protein LOC123891953 [Trifolium pratense]|uniref:uncharacterized protein LOC123891953 n=1 Tax=Trifolium pratense TaxID=57577 RepID=UPI001E69538E|nr:uncharacterized protein LOC123891953 [Trifolium pratense]
MSNLSKLQFEALDISGKNYLAWALDAEINLAAEGDGNAIKTGNNASEQQKAKALIFIRRHLHEGLKNEYLTVKDPLVLWNKLKERYEHQKTIILPTARYNWIHLRLQDFKTVTDYNSAMFQITTQLELCGEKITDADMLEKTFSTFHASNVLLQQQYREKGFTKYSQLISCLLLAEQNNQLLMKNHEARPTGAAPFPEVNVASHQYDRGRGRGRGNDRGRGRGRNHNHIGIFKNSYSRQKRQNHEKGNGGQSSKNNENICHRCGSKNHWAHTCRTPKHLINLYQQSLKEKRIETHFAIDDAVEDVHPNYTHFAIDDAVGDVHPNYGNMDVTHLEIGDFIDDPNGRIDHLIGDGSIKK